MTEIGIQRLGAGDREKDSAQRDQPDEAVLCQEMHAVIRIEGKENFRVTSDFDHTGDSDHQEPYRHDRTEEGGNLGRAVCLESKQRQQNKHRQRHYGVFEGGRRQFNPLDRGEHRKGRRNDRVAIE